jgi:hypothetical protein
MLVGRRSALFYNKYPFVHLHGLLVPERNQQLPQFLQQSDLYYLWQVTEELGAGLPGIGFGYNSYGAYASVNHLHFQMFERSNPLPLSDRRWRHNGGDQDYPLDCHGFDAVDEAWNFIDGLHQQKISYNLLALPGILYCLPRRKQGSYRHAEWTGGFAWYETAGGFTIFEPGDFEKLAVEEITGELALLGEI